MELKIIVLFVIEFSFLHGCFVRRSVDYMLVNGKVTPYCKYNDVKYLAGQTFQTTDCYECICDASFGLLCCGYGRNVHRFDFVGSEHCDIIEKGCMMFFVKKGDHGLDCFTGEPLLNDINKDRMSSLKSVLDSLPLNRNWKKLTDKI